MPYRGGSLTDLFAPATMRAATVRAQRSIAKAGGDALTHRAKRHTPQDSGATAAQGRSLAVRKVPEGYEGGTENPHYVARFVEHGVRRHDLKPTGERGEEALSTPEGPPAGARHPGHRGAHPLARAAAEVEAELAAIAQPHLSAWPRRSSGPQSSTRDRLTCPSARACDAAR